RARTRNCHMLTGGTGSGPTPGDASKAARMSAYDSPWWRHRPGSKWGSNSTDSLQCSSVDQQNTVHRRHQWRSEGAAGVQPAHLPGPGVQPRGRNHDGAPAQAEHEGENDLPNLHGDSLITMACRQCLAPG